MIKEEIEEENKYREILYNQVLDFIKGNSDIKSMSYELFEKCEKKFVLSIIALVNYFIDNELPESLRYEYYNIQDHMYYTNNYLLDSMEVTEDMINEILYRDKDFLFFIKSEKPKNVICSFPNSSNHQCNVYLYLKKEKFNIPNSIKEMFIKDDPLSKKNDYNILMISDSSLYNIVSGDLDQETKNIIALYKNKINDWKI